MRTNAAIRRRDINKLIINYGESRGYKTDMLQCLVARGCANFLGTTQLIDVTPVVPRGPGRPAGVRGMKKGTGRRSIDGWIQAELGDASVFVELCKDIIQSRSKKGIRPSLAVTMAIVAAKAPRALTEWTGKAPRWAATAWLLSNSTQVEEPAELELPTEEVVALDSSEDFITFTEEQIKEINNG